MIRIEGIQIVAARLAAGLESTKRVESSTPFRQQRMPQSWSPGSQQPPVPLVKQP
jgi:hypothetical protein